MFTQQPAAQQSPAQQSPAQQQPAPWQAASAQAGAGASWQPPQFLDPRRGYERVPEPSFDPLTNRRYLLRMVRQWFIFGAIFAIGAILSLIPTLLLSAVGLGVVFILWSIVGVIVAVALWIAYLIAPVTALLSEWKLLVDYHGAGWQATITETQAAVQRRQVPLDSVQVRRVSLPDGESRDYLELRRGIFAGYISSFPQGNDLYVGWTFWLRLSPGRWLLMLIGRAFQEILQRGSDLHVTLRYESAKALRDAMHGAMHEGIESATSVRI